MAPPFTFASKSDARRFVWDRLADEGRAAYPFPPHGRIPNFRQAKDAAARLFTLPLLQQARRIKVNPDSPQRHVRAEALRRGITVFVPTPRLAGGFMVLEPARIPPQLAWEAAAKEAWAEFARPVALLDLPQMDLIVTGSAVVTQSGKRAGKGAGFSDLEFAILRELGHPPVPVATTVADVQVVGDFPVASHDQPLSLIATPTQVITVAEPLPAPSAIDWARLPASALDEMPVLQELRATLARRQG